MKTEFQKFKQGDKLEITAVENGFIISHRICRTKSIIKPRRLRYMEEAADELEDVNDFEMNGFQGQTKFYIAQDASDIVKIIQEVTKKELAN